MENEKKQQKIIEKDCFLAKKEPLGKDTREKGIRVEAHIRENTVI